MKLYEHIVKTPRNRKRRIKNRLSAYIESWGEQKEKEMANSPSSTTSGMNVATSNVSVQRRAQGLLDPSQQEALGGDIRTGVKTWDETKVSPAPNAADSGVQYMGTDSSAVSDMIEVKPVDFRTIEGSYPGDHRMPAKDGVTPALDDIANSGRCPRCQMPQQSSSSKLDTPKPAEYPGNLTDSDAGN